eukprot:jgi/Psemu1/34223/gm1.34223_g
MSGCYKDWDATQVVSIIHKSNGTRSGCLYSSLFLMNNGNKIQCTALEMLFKGIESNHKTLRNVGEPPQLKHVVIKLDTWKKILGSNGPLLGEEDKKRRDRRTPRIAITRYSQSAFMYLYRSDNDQVLPNCCGVDHVVFRELLDLFEPLYNFSFFFALQEHSAAKVYLPNEKETQQYIDAISAKHPVLAPHRVWGACDGLKLHLQQSGNWMKQNQYYNGWTCATYVKRCFDLCSRWQDPSTQADYGLYEKMEVMYDKFLAKVVVNSAFKLSKKPYYLIWSSQSDPFNAAALIVNCAATSVRQLSEWGM